MRVILRMQDVCELYIIRPLTYIHNFQICLVCIALSYANALLTSSFSKILSSLLLRSSRIFLWRLNRFSFSSEVTLATSSSSALYSKMTWFLLYWSASFYIMHSRSTMLLKMMQLSWRLSGLFILKKGTSIICSLVTLSISIYSVSYILSMERNRTAITFSL